MSKPHRPSRTSLEADLSALFARQHPLELATLSGQQHKEASLQETEPFWHQYPEPSGPQVYYYPACDLYSVNPLYLSYLPDMETAPLIIGYKSRYNASNEKRELRDCRYRIPRETVKVYAGDEEVGTIPLGVLLRFSRYAKEAFPKPSIVHGGEQGVGVSAATPSAVSDKLPKTFPKKWSDTDEETDELKIDTPGPARTKTKSSISETIKQKYFQVYIDEVYEQPSLASLEYLLKWMDANRSTRNNEPLQPLTPVPLHMVKLNVLIDTYAAALAYNLTPFPHELRHEILTRLTATPVDLEGFEYIAFRLPLSDPIMTRLFTSHFEHIDAQNYPDGVADAIFSFVTEYDGKNADEPFFKRYNKISRSRKFKQRQAKRDQKKGERFDCLRGDFESFAGPDAVLEAEAVKTPAVENVETATCLAANTIAEKSARSSAEQTPNVSEEEAVSEKSQGRHRNRREQQKKKAKAKAAAK